MYSEKIPVLGSIWKQLKINSPIIAFKKGVNPVFLLMHPLFVQKKPSNQLLLLSFQRLFAFFLAEDS